MPLTDKGKKIQEQMREEYGKAVGDRIFYAMERSGKLKGVAQKRKS